MIPLRDNVPTRHFPVVTFAIIVANALVYFLYQQGGVGVPEGPVNQSAWQPCEVDDSCRVIGYDWPVNLFTSMFMHGSIDHILGNMLFLWIFGNNVEDAMGRVRFLVFYLLAGIAATALQTGITLETASDAAARIPNLGASGAISGVLGAYFLLLPRARVLTAIFLGFLLFIREVPALLYLGLWFVFQLLEGGMSFVHPQSGGGVAYFAHIGGFVFGFFAIKLFQTGRPRLRHSY